MLAVSGAEARAKGMRCQPVALSCVDSALCWVMFDRLRFIFQTIKSKGTLTQRMQINPDSPGAVVSQFSSRLLSAGRA